MNHCVSPLVCSCSGCCNAAQLANAVALKRDRAEVAEMSCVAGVGGDVPSLVRTATSERPTVALDGCALACLGNTLARYGVAPTLYFLLSDQGARKRDHSDFDPVKAQRTFFTCSRKIGPTLPGAVVHAPSVEQPKIAEEACS